MLKTILRNSALLSVLTLLGCSSSDSGGTNGSGTMVPAAGSAGQAVGQAGTLGAAGTTAGTAGAAGMSAAGASGMGGMSAAAGSSMGGASGMAGAGGASGGNFSWPDGKAAAVTLTYDDGLDSHLAHVVPLLDMHGIKASFFVSSFPGVDHDWALPNTTDALTARHEAWAAVAASGHEISGHTVNHPCTQAINPGQSPGFLLDVDYDMARITAELDDTVARIKRLGAPEPLTFGYPCYSDRLGVGPGQGGTVEVLGMQLPQGQSFVSEVSSRFFAARGSDEGIADPATVDLKQVPYVPAGPRTETDTVPTLADLTAVVDSAIAQGGWVVFLMHGVAGDTLPTDCDNGLTYAPETCVIDYLDTATAVHDGLVDYLVQNEASVWTTTFKEVAQHIAMERGL